MYGHQMSLSWGVSPGLGVPCPMSELGLHSEVQCIMGNIDMGPAL